MRASIRLLTSFGIALLILFCTLKLSIFTTYDPTLSDLVSKENDRYLSNVHPASLQRWQTKQNVDVLITAKLSALKLSHEFEYRRVCISTTVKAGIKRSPLCETSQDFFKSPTGDVLAESHLFSSQLPACQTHMTLNVPEWEHLRRVDTGILMLGMATTLSRFDSSIMAISQWLSGTNTVLQVLLTDDVDVQDLQVATDTLRVKISALDMNVEFHFQRFESASDGLKNFALAEVLYNHKSTQTKWIGVIDDDTFFVSLQQLVLALDKFDDTQLWYVGSLSEGLTRIAQEGFKAWGGAGIFLSTPLMAIVAAHAEDCRELDQGYGDLLWRDCIVQHTSPTVQLTQMRGLNQVDMWKDVSGWYESVHDPLYTIHHWKSWHYHPVPSMHLVTRVAGPDVLLQRYRFTDDTVLYNGYSLVHYPQGLPDINRTELTMVEDVGVERFPQQNEFLHSMGKTREAMLIGKTKVQWKLETSFLSDHDTVSQIYVKRADTNQGQDIDSVVQIDWCKA